MKSIVAAILVIMTLFGLGACSDPQLRVAEGHPYTLSGILCQEGTTKHDSIVTLIVDRHETYCSVMGDTLPAHEELQLAVDEGRFFYQGHTPLDADELYLYTQQGYKTRLYGLPGARLNIQILQNGDVIQDAIDTTDMLRALLLRDSIPMLKDSLHVRRALGSLPESAKPAWLTQSIDYMLDRMWARLDKSMRLPRVDVPLADTVYHILGNRTESLLLLFWSMEDSLSRDTLAIFNAIARDYGLYDHAETFDKEKAKTRRPKAHRIELMSLCLQCEDSAAWASATQGIAGRHAILEGGLAHPLAITCQIQSLPWLVLVDRFGNYQTHNVWGDDLYIWLDKTPLNSTVNNKMKK